jgi:chromosome segregation ATPase
MKKLVLVIICSLMLILLIAFNYLLWDRETQKKSIQTLESSKASNDALISGLYKQRQELESENSDLKEQLDEVQKFLEDSKETNNDIQKENGELKSTVTDMGRKIDILKKQVGTETIKQQLDKWAECINNHEYEKAYEVEKQSASAAELMSADEYESFYEGFLEKIEIEAVRYLPEDIVRTNTISFEVEFNITFLENYEGESTEHYKFTRGINRRIVSVDFDDENETWIITNISEV